MIIRYSYNEQTRSFSSSIATAKRIAGVVSIGASAAAGAIGLARTISDKAKFTIVYNTTLGPKQKVVKADSKNEALDKFNKSGIYRNVMNTAKAFRLPDEDQAANDYMNNLKSSSSNINSSKSTKL